MGAPGGLLEEGKLRLIDRLLNLSHELREMDEDVKTRKLAEDDARKSAQDDGF